MFGNNSLVYGPG